MKYSRWASQNRRKLGINAEKQKDKREVTMSTDKIDKILDKVRERKGIPTKEGEARKAAVNALIRKPQEKTLRPESQALVDAIRKGR